MGPSTGSVTAEEPGFPLWRLVSKTPLPKIHLLSDLHLDTGPYELPAELEFDILVAAGDIGPLELAVPWLAALDKPVIYVLGNHEYYGQSWGKAMALARRFAQGTQVRVLERNEAVLHGVRFLGATLWTSYGDWNRDLVWRSLEVMKDYREIDAGQWFESPKNVSWFQALLAGAQLRDPTTEESNQKPRFHPAIALQAYQRTMAWLDGKLRTPFDGPTVVVTHHPPSFASLRATGINEGLLEPENWDLRDRQLAKVACYGSPHSFKPGHYQAVDMWLHGHLHTAVDLLDDNVRIVSNPRGHHVRPFSERDVKMFALFGYPVSEEQVEASKVASKKAPFRGDGWGFDRSLVLDFEDGYERPLLAVVEPILDEQRERLEQAAEAAPYTLRKSKTGKWAKRCFDADVCSFYDAAEALRTRLQPALWGLSPVHRAGPQAPLPPRDAFFPEGIPRNAIDQCLGSMRAWLDWAETLPNIAVATTVLWAKLAVSTLQALEQEYQVTARVRMLPVTALRRADVTDVVVVLESNFGEPGYVQKWGHALWRDRAVELANLPPPLFRTLEECPEEARERLLTKEELESFLCGFSGADGVK